MARTNIVIDDALMAEAQKLSGIMSKRETVERALKLLVEDEKRMAVLRYRGKLRWESDLDAMRRD